MQEPLPLDVIIELKDCLILQQDHLVLSGVNLNVKKGEFLYLVGRVGSGKSSLIKTLNAQIPLKGGTGIVAGFNLSKLRTKDIQLLRRKLGIVFQDFQLLTDSGLCQSNSESRRMIEQGGVKFDNEKVSDIRNFFTHGY